MLLLIDNYDSFTYNLVQYFQILKADVRVIRNDAAQGDLLELSPQHLVVSPGPGNPSQAGISKAMIAKFSHQIPILGVCLGHQALAEVYGGIVVRANYPMHGKTSPIYHDGEGVFAGLSQGFLATRYHSLIVDRKSLPSCLKISAETSDGEIMGIRHREYPLEGVQFHPESILTEAGMTILQNFLTQRI